MTSLPISPTYMPVSGTILLPRASNNILGARTVNNLQSLTYLFIIRKTRSVNKAMKIKYSNQIQWVDNINYQGFSMTTQPSVNQLPKMDNPATH